jgi:hypothetical protein
MRPNLSALQLGGRPLATTGEFSPLDSDGVKERNAQGNLEAFTVEPFREDSEPWHTFRVRAETPRADGEYDYSYYRGESLWEYLKRDNIRDPLTRGPIWHEDYTDLHDKFAPNEPVHRWAANLPRKASAPALPPLNERLQAALTLAPGAPVAYITGLAWNHFRTLSGVGNSASLPSLSAFFGSQRLTNAQVAVMRYLTATMTQLVEQYVDGARLRSWGREAELQRCAEEFLNHDVTSYGAARIFCSNAEAFALADEEGYERATQGLHGLMEAFVLTMGAPAWRNAAFERRLLQYLHTVVQYGGPLLERIERDEARATEFRAALEAYIREHSVPVDRIS